MLKVVVVFACGTATGILLQRLADRMWPVANVQHKVGAGSRTLIGFGFGVLFTAHYSRYGLDPTFVKLCLFAVGMGLVMFVNYRTLLVPNAITLHGITAGLILSLFTPPGLGAAALGVVGGGGALFLVAELYRRTQRSEGIGMGLVKLQGTIGAFLGWRLMLVAFIIAVMAGTVHGVFVSTQKTQERHLLPLGVHMAASAIVASLYGDAIIRWYLSQLR